MTAAFTISPALSMGCVALTVADLGRSMAYYRNEIGLSVREEAGDTAVLGTPERDLLVLQERPGARPARGRTGLYHFALLVPTRRDLAQVLAHFAARQTPLTGFADHGVSEAIYLSDPDGHGIELYRDRPRSEWEYPNGRLKMVTDPIDMDGVLGELRNGTPAWSGIAPGTVMGHVHLHVADIAAAESFYVDLLGIELVTRYGPSASFVAAGGYHHHIGLNTWAGVGAPRPSPEMASLQWFEICLPDTESLQAIRARLSEAQRPFTDHATSLTVHDPSGNTLKLTLATD